MDDLDPGNLSCPCPVFQNITVLVKMWILDTVELIEM